MHGDDMTKKFAVIENGAVTNIVIADSQMFDNWIDANGCSIGDTWDGVSFTPAQPEPAKVPQSVTMRQARLALLQAGKLATVNAAIASMGGAQGESARIEWDYSNEVQRAQPLVAALGGVLGMTSDQLDQLFITAATL